MSVEIASTVVAAFPTSAVAERAIAEAIALGVQPGRVGRLEDGHGPVLVSVMLDEDGAPALDALRRLSSAPLVDIAAAQTMHRRVPHPGVDERNGVKLPFGGEFPRRPLGTVAPPRASHRVLEPEARARTFDEIDGGFTEAEMRIEADRCVRCPEPPCQVACPAGNDIPAFIELLSRGDVAGGFDVLRRTNTFSAVCGRVCDVDRQCEGSCVLRTGGGQAVQIGRLERYVADAARGRAAPGGLRPTATGPHIAVVGAGPAGLAAASDLADAGCHVEIIDAGAVAGGAVAWGIPEFRLPAAVLAREIEALERQGIRFRFGSELGRDVQLEDLAETNAAVVLALGTQGSVSVPLPGVELEGVWQAKDLLARVKLARTGAAGVTTPVVGPRTVVIGGGNTALDAAQTLMRLRSDGATPEVTIVYRRGEDEMPARGDEVASARSEGVGIRSWATPIAILATNDGRRVGGVRFLGTRAIRPAEGRRSQIVPIAGSDFELLADTVVFALGYRTVLPTLTGVRSDKRGLIAADTRRGRTTRNNVWAIGDVVTGPKTVVHAMAAGRRAARDVLRALGRSAS